MKSNLSLFLILTFLLIITGLTGCGNREFLSTPIISQEDPSLAATAFEQTPTADPSPTTQPSVPTPTQTATQTATFPVQPSRQTATSTSQQTPTPAQPVAIVQQQAHCRYGPGTAFLHSHDLYPGDRSLVDGRNSNSSWLWIQPEGLERHCWAAASVLTWQGDVNALPVVTSKLPYSNLYGPPQNVQTARNGNQVSIAWDPLPFTVDDFRGYMLELRTCQGGTLTSTTIQTNDTLVTVVDETDCGGDSGGRLWGVEKHGYTQSVEIPWP